MEQPSQSSTFRSVKLPTLTSISHCLIIGPFARFPRVVGHINPTP